MGNLGGALGKLVPTIASCQDGRNIQEVAGWEVSIPPPIKKKRPHTAAVLIAGSSLQISKALLLIDIVLGFQPLDGRLNENFVPTGVPARRRGIAALLYRRLRPRTT